MTMSPIALFLQADLVVKSVMILLITASIWTWAIIVGWSLRIGRAARESDVFERAFWKAEDVDAFARDNRDQPGPGRS